MRRPTTERPSHDGVTLVPATALRAALTGSALLILTSCQSTSTSTASSNSYMASNAAPIVVTKTITSGGNDNIDWAALMPPLFQQARTLVEANTGEDLSDVTLNLANDSSITAEVSHETQRLIHSQFDNQRFANRFLNSVMSGQQGTYAALYATRKSEVMVSLPLMKSYQSSLPNNRSIQESAILALLIHELVHAADDKRYNIHKNRDLNFRASFAQSAAFEGHAQFVTRTICTKANCLSGLEALDEFMFGRRNPPNKLTQTVQAVSRNVLEYSYVEGERFIAHLANRPNGQQLIGRLKSYPNTQREQRNQMLISASTDFDHPWLNGLWTSVQTSPLKGVNLRTDPDRRNAAVDGFTRLITSMVALQLYNQAKPDFSPIELTVLTTESAQTAKLFAKTLHENTRINGAQLTQSNALMKVTNAVSEEPAVLYLSREPAQNNQTYFTLVGVSDINVVQIAGIGTSEQLFVDYVDQLLLKLAEPANALTQVSYQR